MYVLPTSHCFFLLSSPRLAYFFFFIAVVAVVVVFVSFLPSSSRFFVRSRFYLVCWAGYGAMALSTAHWAAIIIKIAHQTWLTHNHRQRLVCRKLCNWISRYERTDVLRWVRETAKSCRFATHTHAIRARTPAPCPVPMPSTHACIK